MDDTGGLRRHKAVSVNVSHDIVTPALLLKSSGCELVVLDAHVLLQLVDGLLRDIEAELALRFGQVEPELSPGAETVARREEVLHLLGGVPRVEGAAVLSALEIFRLGRRGDLRRHWERFFWRLHFVADVLRIGIQSGRHDVWCSYHCSLIAGGRGTKKCMIKSGTH